MIVKRKLDAHIESFSYETKTKKQHQDFIIDLQVFLKEYRTARGR